MIDIVYIWTYYESSAFFSLYTAINDAKSIIWQIEQIGTGNFEIICPFRKEYVNIKTADCISIGQRKEVGLIENIEISLGENSTMKLSGRLGTAFLDRWFYYKFLEDYKLKEINLYERYSASVVQNCREIVQSSVIPKIPQIHLSDSLPGSGSSIPNDLVVTCENCLSLIQNMLETGIVSTQYGTEIHKLGHRMLITSTSGYRLALEYEIFDSQETEIVISPTLKNVMSFVYTVSSENTFNHFIIKGEGSGGAEGFYTNLTLDGLPAKETKFDSNISRSYFPDTEPSEQVQKTDEVYATELQGQCKLAFKTNPQISIKCQVDLTQFKLGEDYNVGDYVRIVEPSLNIDIKKAQISSVTIAQDETNYKIYADIEGAN